MALFYIIFLAALLRHADAGCYNGTIPSCSSCGGSCNPQPCYCATEPFDTCVPNEECLTPSNDCCPSGYYYDATIPCCTDVVHCNPACATDEICVLGTCECKNDTYKSTTIENLVPSVKCDADVITVSMSRCLLTTLGYDYTSISINGNSSNLCNYVYEDHVNGTVFENIQTQLKEGFCGNNVTKNSSIYILSNNVHISPIQVGNIITKNPVSLNFNCTYDLTKQVSVNYTLHPISQTIYLPGVNGTGSYPLTMSAYKDPEYITQLQETDNVPIGELVYVSLNVLAVDGDLFALRTVQCVASGTDSRTGGVNLLAGGCKVDNSDIYVNVSENGVSLESRFSFSMFQFQDQTQLYLFCDVLLCDKTANCSRCDTGRSTPSTQEVKIVLPIAEKLLYDFGSRAAWSWAVLSSTLLAMLYIHLY